jgi:myosin-1
MKALTACNPHYIRCIKPNNNKAKDFFDPQLVLHQARYLGLLENIRVRRAGYAYRQLYDRFFFRYRVISSKTWPTWHGDYRSGCLAILEQMHLDPGEYQQGKTKIFIRHPETVRLMKFSKRKKERKKWFQFLTITIISYSIWKNFANEPFILMPTRFRGFSFSFTCNDLFGNLLLQETKLCKEKKKEHE